MTIANPALRAAVVAIASVSLLFGGWYIAETRPAALLVGVLLCGFCGIAFGLWHTLS